MPSVPPFSHPFSTLPFPVRRFAGAQRFTGEKPTTKKHCYRWVAPLSIGLFSFLLGIQKPDLFQKQPAPSLLLENLPTKPVIAIDAGHGGQDPGAVQTIHLKKAVIKLREADVALIYAKRLQEKLLMDGRFIVLLRREQDEYMSPLGIVQWSNTVKPDVFISFHANRSTSIQANGIELHYDEQHSTPNTPYYAVADSPDPSTQTPDNPEGRKLVETLQTNLTNAFSKIHQSPAIRIFNEAHRPHERQNLRVTDCNYQGRSVLIEVGYLSNPSERKALTSEFYQNAFVNGIYHTLLTTTSLLKEDQPFNLAKTTKPK